MTSSQDDRPVGLRERKKARTRDSIQAHALRLFTEQGYAETTVEQIAEAAEVSPSTFFRYFPTKEESVLYDRMDPVLVALFLRQPARMSALSALRAAIREVLEQTSREDSEREGARHALILSVPELRSRLTERVFDTMDVFADAVARRADLGRDDPKVLAFAGATIGAILGGVYGRSGTDSTDAPSMMNDEMLKRIDESLALLEDGLPL